MIRRHLHFIIALLMCSMVTFTITLNSCKENTKPISESRDTQEAEETEDSSEYFYGIRLDSLSVIEEIVSPNDFLANILLDYQVDYSTIHQITVNAKDVFDFRRMRAGNKFYILHSDDTTAMPKYFIYDKSTFEYIVCDIRNSVCVYAGKKPIRTEKKTASGIINHSLYLTLDNNDIHPTLALLMADVYAWTVDFYHLQKGDRFKVIYEEEFVDTNSIGVSRLVAAVFDHYGKDLYATRYRLENDSIATYFDGEGESLQKAFLRSPLKFGIMTSPYTNRRFHPIQKRYTTHKGTDYAAPMGTPILSTADGVILVATFKQYNGNYVKVQHSSTYTTQYLHMSKFASGIKPGRHVKQGETIGYVGSTGLSTGPHVCYRFWKNGEQVDHIKEDVPPSDPVPVEELEAYLDHFKGLLTLLDSIQYPVPKPEEITDSLITSK